MTMIVITRAAYTQFSFVGCNGIEYIFPSAFECLASLSLAWCALEVEVSYVVSKTISRLS